MILKANRRRAFVKTFWPYFLMVLVMVGVPGLAKGTTFNVWELLGFCIMAGTLFGLCAALFQTPREIRWDDDKVSIRSIIPGSGEYQWNQLVSYRPQAFRGFGLFVMKFQGVFPYQILASGFDREEWNRLQEFLRQRFPEKQR